MNIKFLRVFRVFSVIRGMLFLGFSRNSSREPRARLEVGYQPDLQLLPTAEDADCAETAE
jgi:hypothetical protein